MASKLMQPRRTVIVAKKILSTSAARKALTAQIRYLSREGAEADGGRTCFFDRNSDQADAQAFLDRSKADAGHYRLVVSPDDGYETPDLKAFTRRLLEEMETGLDRKSDWLAAVHHDTGRPHVHIVLKDGCKDGRRLALSGAWLNNRLRETATEVATEVMGPWVERSETRTIKADRFTDLDQIIIEATRDGRFHVAELPVQLRSEVLRRVGHLEMRGWITAAGRGRWDVPSGLRHTLRSVAQRDARAVAAIRGVAQSGWRDERARLEEISPRPGEELTGAYVGLHRLGRYPAGAQVVLLDTTDGRLGHVLMQDAKSVMCLDRIPEGAVILLQASARGPRDMDLNIASVASKSGGVWSADEHILHVAGAGRRYLSFHVNRLEAMHLEGACERRGDDRFAIPEDYVAKALAADCAQWGEAQLHLHVLDQRPLDEQVSAIGLTWLDRLMASTTPPLDGPFGVRVRKALPSRENWLRMAGLGGGNPFTLTPTDVETLRVLGAKTALEPLTRTGKEIFLMKDGQRASGVYVGRLHLSGTPYGILEAESAFHVLPWKPGMEVCRGQVMNAAIQNSQVAFRTARGANLVAGLG
ncbi:MAG: DUF3363 domain-containing protein [Brevundimonas sp.]